MSQPPRDTDRSLADGDELSELLGQLEAAADDDLEAAMPSDEEFARMRAAVLGRLGASPSAVPFGWRRALPWAAGFGALLLGSGFLLGRFTAAGAHRVESPRYENVRLVSLPEGRLRLTFDAVRASEVEVPADDPLAIEVLTQALAGGTTSVGDRLRAVEAASQLPSERTRQALAVAMRHDANLGVRLAAQRGLVGAGQGDAVEAMLALLREDGPLPMYLIAIDYLEQRGVEPERVREALRGSPPGTPAALLLARSPSAGGLRAADQEVH